MADHYDTEFDEEMEVVHPPVVGNILESRIGHLDDVLLEKLEEALHKPTAQVLLHDVAKIASEHDPIDLAYAVTRLPLAARFVVYENLTDFEDKVIFMINTGRTTRVAIFRHIDDAEIAQILSSVPPDEAAYMIDDMSDRRFRRVISLLDPNKASRILELHSHDRNSAGRLMTNEFFSFHVNTSIGEVAKVIRNNPGIELTRSVFVFDNDGELVGYVPERNLIINPSDLPLKQVMRPIFHSVNAASSRDEVVDIVERYKVPALPVVDDQNHLIGVISYVDVVEAMEDLADETIATIAGTAEDISEHEPTLRRFFWRAPWLVVTVCVGLITSTTMFYFENRPWFLFLPFLVPLITGMSGNVGIQCSTVLVRSMSTGEISPGTRKAAIASELVLGSIIGLVFGIAVGCVVYLVHSLGFSHVGASSLLVALTIAFGLFGACMTAITLGAFSPFFFSRMGIDPAVASGPIVTALNDLVSTLMFFFIAWNIHRVFAPW